MHQKLEVGKHVAQVGDPFFFRKLQILCWWSAFCLWSGFFQKPSLRSHNWYLAEYLTPQGSLVRNRVTFINDRLIARWSSAALTASKVKKNLIKKFNFRKAREKGTARHTWYLNFFYTIAIWSQEIEIWHLKMVGWQISTGVLPSIYSNSY